MYCYWHWCRKTGQTASSICLNATATPFTPSTASCYINPIRTLTPATSAMNYIFYNPTTFEMTSNPFANSVGTVITATVTLALPLSSIYTITSAAATTVTLPTVSSSYSGASLTFRRTGANIQVITFANTTAATVMLAPGSATAVTTFTMAATIFNLTIICNGTFWMGTNSQ